MTESAAKIHPTADVSPQAHVGAGTRVWHHAQIREGATIGEDCIIGKDVYIDANVAVGRNVKIQNSALVYHGATVEDGVFIGPQVCLTNDRVPRAITPEGKLKGTEDWVVGPILLKYGSSIGAGAIILAGVTVGRFAMVAAGAVVTKDVPDYGLAVGVPSRVVGYVCPCGHRLEKAAGQRWLCRECGRQHLIEEGA